MLIDPAQPLDVQIAQFRIGERLGLTVAILIVGLVVMVAFWRSVQKMEFKVSKDSLGLGGTVVLATPIFVLLAMILYAWVSLSNPITFTSETPQSDTPNNQDANASVSSRRSSLTAITKSEAGSSQLAMTAQRDGAIEQLRSLNCLAATSGAVSERVEVDLAALKLAVLESVWADTWGEYASFAAWVALGSGEPTSMAKAIWEGTHSEC